MLSFSCRFQSTALFFPEHRLYFTIAHITQSAADGLQQWELYFITSRSHFVYFAALWITTHVPSEAKAERTDVRNERCYKMNSAGTRRPLIRVPCSRSRQPVWRDIIRPACFRYLSRSHCLSDSVWDNQLAGRSFLCLRCVATLALQGL